MRLSHVPCVLYAVCMLGAVRAGDAASAPAPATRDVWVEVRINNVTQSDFALVHIDLRGHLSVRVEDLRVWHMKPPSSAVAGSFVRIDDVPGLRVHLEDGEMVLRMDADPRYSSRRYSTARVLWRPRIAAFRPSFWATTCLPSGKGAAGETYSALLQAGSSLGRASFTSSWLASRVVDTPNSNLQAINDPQSGWHRLDTALLLDFPEYTARLTVGDGITSPGTLGDAVRFTGVHWATDYATRPGLTPYALPAVTGTANMPSSVEIYINNALVQRSSVDAGPFQLNNIPVPVGEGAVDIRMRDMLGQVQQLSVPYLVSPQLITAGLTTVDLAAGTVREDYGIESFAYGKPFLSGAMLHGLNNATTLNASAEILADQFSAREAWHTG